MKKTIFLLLFTVNFTFGQVPNWIKNAQPLTDKEIALINKKGAKMVKAYKDYPENSDEKQITYRINNIPYLQNLEKLKTELSNWPNGTKPKPFPLFLSHFIKASANSIDSDKKMSQNKEITFSKDTIIDIVDVIFPTDYFTLKTFTPLNNKLRLSGMSLVIVDNNQTRYELKNIYNDLERNYPVFHDWLYKYRLYGDAVYQPEQEMTQFKPKNNISSIVCSTSVDDFTNEKITETNQRSLITLKSNLIIDRSSELSEQGYYIDFDDFVCAFKGMKIGNKKILQVYISIAKETKSDYYGLLQKDNFIEFKLENDKIIKLPFERTSSPELKSNHVHIYYRNTLLLTDNDIKELLASNIKKIRIHYSQGYRDYDITENNDLLKKILECIK